MDLMQIIVTVTGILLIGATLWFFFGKQASQGAAAKGEPYSCPMHPWITSADPAANCSVCGMKLVRGAVDK